MPIYEYVCLDCGKRYEALRAMRDADAPIVCVTCESNHTSRLLAVLFATSGGKDSYANAYPSGNGGGCAGCGGGSCGSCRH